MAEHSHAERIPGLARLRERPATRAAEPRALERKGSWLCPTAADRERMLDMDRRLAPVRAATIAILALAALFGTHWLGWWTLAPLLGAAAVFALGGRVSDRVERPEYVLFAAWVGAEAVIAATVAIAGIDSNLLAWLAIPVITLGARFSMHGVIAGAAIALALMVGVAFATDAGAVIEWPPLLVAPAAVLISVAVLSTALMRSDLQHRDEAVLDQLTGMLNRNSLARRAVELEQQSAITGEPIGVVIGDIDHFKRFNDAHGHAAGDAVLTDVAYTIRKQLRAFDLAYRLGGEEFLIVIPGADLEAARRLSVKLCRVIATERLGGFGVTMSFGVGASRHGEQFEYERVFERADAALYEAKRAGRNRVVAAPAAG
jgi:diguanylate cyclase (GGDEF)-like protein